VARSERFKKKKQENLICMWRWLLPLVKTTGENKKKLRVKRAVKTIT
jgi:hypothetical protein